MTAWDPSQLLRGLSNAARGYNTGARQGVGEWGEHVLEESQRIVPIEEGSLQNSGTVAQSADGMTAGVGYGSGPAAPYAVKQHEDLSLRHDPGRTAKYLELPLQASKATGMKIVADAIRRSLR